MSLEYKGELNIESLIEAPLIAAVKANSLMQREQVRFLLDTCFSAYDVNDVCDKALSPVMVKMLLTSSNIDYSKNQEEDLPVSINKMEFQVPLISLIPINSLAVNSVDIDFKMEVTSMNQTESCNNESAAILKGKIANSHQSKEYISDEKQETRSLNVKICANSLPLPKGVIELIDMYTKSIQPVQSSMEKKEQ